MYIMIICHWAILHYNVIPNDFRKVWYCFLMISCTFWRSNCWITKLSCGFKDTPKILGNEQLADELPSSRQIRLGRSLWLKNWLSAELHNTQNMYIVMPRPMESCLYALRGFLSAIRTCSVGPGYATDRNFYNRPPCAHLLSQNGTLKSTRKWPPKSHIK